MQTIDQPKKLDEILVLFVYFSIINKETQIVITGSNSVNTLVFTGNSNILWMSISPLTKEKMQKEEIYIKE